MKIKPLELDGVYIIKPELHNDARGYLYRNFCRDEFKSSNIYFDIVQTSISFNLKKGTLRGLHFQRSPYEETKIVQCLQGSIWDVVIDIRAGSPTFGQWLGIELSEENMHMLYISKGLAHGYITTQNNTKLLYYMDTYYEPNHSAGICWNDKIIAIQWPIQPEIISEKDMKLPGLKALLNENKL